MRILVIGAHPDDIEFGCGGTLIKMSKRGARIHFLVLTEGGAVYSPAMRRKEQQLSAKYLKAKIFWGGYKDTEVPPGKVLISKIEEIIKRVKPDIVFCNYPDDFHQDHRALASACSSATRYTKRVVFYEVPTTYNFKPDVFVDVTSVMNEKLRLLKLHASQVNKTRVSGLTILESASSCANFRGYQARVKYAEGFKPLRYLMDI
jgi:LmbE family N-acetylglucosaminyl deacetylase